MCVCPAMRFAPLRPTGMKLGTVLGGKGLLYQEVTRGQRSGQISSCSDRAKTWEGDARPRAIVKCISQRTPSAMSSEVKGRVKFQVARIELKFGEGNTEPRASAKCLSRRMPSKVK